MQYFEFPAHNADTFALQTLATSHLLWTSSRTKFRLDYKSRTQASENRCQAQRRFFPTSRIFQACTRTRHRSLSHSHRPNVSSSTLRSLSSPPLLFRPTNLTHSATWPVRAFVLHMAATAEYGRAGRPARLPARPKSGEPPPAATATAATAATDGGREAARLVCVQSVGHDGDSLAPVRICTLQLIRGAKILHVVMPLHLHFKC